jgi:hypothetical protein
MDWIGAQAYPHSEQLENILLRDAEREPTCELLVKNIFVLT